MATTGWKCYQVIDGFKYPRKCPPESIEFAVNYRPRDDDLFVVTYPKCGTTWTQQIIYLILNNGVPQKNEKKFAFETYLEYTGSESQMKPIIKTHLPFDRMPYSRSAKYLIVFRNPKDAVVSLYHHIKTRDDCPYDFHQFVQQWLAGNIYYQDYFEHNMSYWKHINEPNITYLVYEQMKRRPRDAVLKIGEFLGQHYVDKLLDNNELVLNEVIKYSSIDYMKTDCNDNNRFLLRNGIVGDWRRHFSREDSDRVDQEFDKHFKGTQLETIWANDMKW